MSQWVQRIRFRRLNQLVAARDYLREPQDTEEAKADAAVGVPMEETMPNAVEAPGEEAKAEAAAGVPMEETLPNAVEAPGEEAKGIAPEVVMAEAAASGGGPTGASPVPPGDSEGRKKKRPRPLFLVECNKPLPGRQDEHIHARMQFIYFKIQEALGVKDKRTIYKDFQVLWKNKYRGRVTVDMKDELTLQWLENVIDIVKPKLQTAVEAASGAETCSVGAALSSEDVRLTDPRSIGPDLKTFVINF